jgi:hypothetical protein
MPKIQDISKGFLHAVRLEMRRRKMIQNNWKKIVNLSKETIDDIRSHKARESIAWTEASIKT